MGSRYFAQVAADRALLEEHGFECWPDAEELAHYTFAAVDALCAEMGLALEWDGRGRLRAVPSRGARHE